MTTTLYTDETSFSLGCSNDGRVKSNLNSWGSPLNTPSYIINKSAEWANYPNFAKVTSGWRSRGDIPGSTTDITATVTLDSTSCDAWGSNSDAADDFGFSFNERPLSMTITSEPVENSMLVKVTVTTEEKTKSMLTPNCYIKNPANAYFQTPTYSGSSSGNIASFVDCSRESDGRGKCEISGVTTNSHLGDHNIHLAMASDTSEYGSLSLSLTVTISFAGTPCYWDFW